jgi:hypothetical protein
MADIERASLGHCDASDAIHATADQPGDTPSRPPAVGDVPRKWARGRCATRRPAVRVTRGGPIPRDDQPIQQPRPRLLVQPSGHAGTGQHRLTNADITQFNADITRSTCGNDEDTTDCDIEAPDRTEAWRPMSYQELHHVYGCLDRASRLRTP